MRITEATERMLREDNSVKFLAYNQLEDEYHVYYDNFHEGSCTVPRDCDVIDFDEAIKAYQADEDSKRFSLAEYIELFMTPKRVYDFMGKYDHYDYF